MTIPYEGKEPCCRCIHKNVCGATRCLNEMKYTVAHPFFKIKVECTEYYNERLATMAERGLIEGSETDDTTRSKRSN